MQSVPITTNVVTSKSHSGDTTLCDSLSVTYDMSVVFSGYSCFLFFHFFMAIFVIAFSIYCLFIEVYIFFALTESPSPGGIQLSTSQRSLTSNPPDVPPRSSPRLLPRTDHPNLSSSLRHIGDHLGKFIQ